MKLNIVYIIIGMLCCSQLSLAQYTRYTFHDEEKTQLKEIYHVSDTISNVLEGKYLSYYINGNLESEGLFSNNETSGQWNFYYETGKMKMQGVLKKGSNDGYWIYFYENGVKSMEGEISDMKRTGEWKIYFEDGALKEVGNFLNNRREGHWTYYTEEGKKKGEIIYREGKGDFIEYYSSGEKRAEGPKSNAKSMGSWRYYYKNGKLQAEGEFQNGYKKGVWRYYHRNGTISAIGEYRHNEPEGEWVYYYDDGIVKSKGNFSEGEKNGHWSIFNEDGTLEGETDFKDGSGIYRAFYSSGNLKVEGPVVEGKNNGLWKYYQENGTLEGQCEFVDGRGEYHGYYPDGKLQTKGYIEDGKKIGKWELYQKDGTLSGYYRPFYNSPSVGKEELKNLRQAKRYGIADYKFKKKRFNYFDAKVNEFEGVIMSCNPFTSFMGWIPLGIEFYMQERLGHEFEFQTIRDPFYVRDTDVSLGEIYHRGFSIKLKQKFYNKGGAHGLWYFGHHIGFSDLSHFSNVNNFILPGNEVRASASEQKLEYSLIIGYRLMQNTAGAGFTADGFVGIGAGYRVFDVENTFTTIFHEQPQGKIPLIFNFGVNLGYTTVFGSRGKK